MTHSPKEHQNYLGLALIPQAGVAIGLAFLGQRMLPAEMGDQMLAIILSSSVLYELIGPICAKIGLILAGAIPREALKRTHSATPVVSNVPEQIASEMQMALAQDDQTI